MFVHVSATWRENDWTEINFTKWMLSYLFPLTGCRCLPYHLPHIGGVSSRVIFSLIVSLIKDTKSKNKLSSSWRAWLGWQFDLRLKMIERLNLETLHGFQFPLLQLKVVMFWDQERPWERSWLRTINPLFETFKQILNQHASSWVNKYLVLNRFRL